MRPELLRRLEKWVLFFLIISLPLNSLPKRFSIPGLGGDLSNYFFLLGMSLLIYEYCKYRFTIPKKALAYLLVYMCWQILCLLAGLIGYEYNDYLTIEQIPRLELILGKLQQWSFFVEELIAIKTWVFFRFVKNIIFLNNTVLLISFYIYHLYKDNFKEGFNDIRRACVCLACIMGLYSIVELAWLKFAAKEAESILKIINPFLYDPVRLNGWWPPLLWKNQLRSICQEPSFFGILSILILPMLWSSLFNEGQKKIARYLLLFYFSLMIAATNARTAIVVTGTQLLLLVISAALVGRKNYAKSVLLIVIISVLAVGVNLVDKSTNNIEDSAVKYLDSNLVSLTKTKSRSNTARLANLVANLNTVRDFPIMGVGTGLKDAYIDARLPEFSYSNNEVRNWSRYMHNEGVLKMGYPVLNIYADVAVQNGLIGLLLYMLPIFFICYNILIYYKSIINCAEAVFLVIGMLGLLAAQLSNAAFVTCNGILWGLLFCKIAELKREREIP